MAIDRQMSDFINIDRLIERYATGHDRPQIMIGGQWFKIANIEAELGRFKYNSKITITFSQIESGVTFKISLCFGRLAGFSSTESFRLRFCLDLIIRHRLDTSVRFIFQCPERQKRLIAEKSEYMKSVFSWPNSQNKKYTK